MTVPGRRGGNTGWHRWIARNLPALLGFLMLGWLVFLSTRDLKLRSLESRLKVTVRTGGSSISHRPAQAVEKRGPEKVFGEEDEARGRMDPEADEEPLEEEEEEEGEEDLEEEDDGKPAFKIDLEAEEEEEEELDVEKAPPTKEELRLDRLRRTGEAGEAKVAGTVVKLVDPPPSRHWITCVTSCTALSRTVPGPQGGARDIATPDAKDDIVGTLMGGGLYGAYGKEDVADRKNSAKAKRADLRKRAEDSMQPSDSPRDSDLQGSDDKELPSSPRYKKSWDVKTFVDVVSDVKKFLASDFAYPEEKMIVTHKNYQEIMKEKMSARTGRSLPKDYPYPRTIDPGTGKVDQPFNTCALVGNSGIMKLQRFGHIIDQHDAVMRVNQGPAHGYKRFVGGRTTFRLLNKKWVSMYVTKLEGRGVLLPIESPNCTYLATRSGRGSFEKLAATVKRERPDITTYWLSQGVQNRAYKLLAAFRNAASKINDTLYTGGFAPSSGLISLTYLLQVCDKVAVYGLSSEKSSSVTTSTWPYHYFAFKNMPMLHLDSVQLRAHPHHSFEAEGDLIRILAKGGRVKYCSDPMIPANKLETCGWVEADLNVS